MKYRYREEVLKNISMEIHRGEKVALIGDSGSGKTTLTKLLQKHYLAQEGEILFGGVNIKTLGFTEIKEKIGVVAQDVFLFRASVFYNIAAGRKNASLE